MKKYFIALAFLALAAAVPGMARAGCVEVSLSTCIGDFANGGDLETGSRLLGNASSYSFGILQDNKVRIYISSGHFWNTSSTPSTAGNVGIATNWNPTTMGDPQYTLDVRGMIRSTTGFMFPDGTIQITAAAASTIRTYQIVVGTLGAIGVDYASNSVVQVTNQIYTDKGVSLGSTNTVRLNIFFRPGVYGGPGSTTPANVGWYTVPIPSATIFVMESDSQCITSNYGIQDGFTYDAGSRPFSVTMNRVGSGSRFKNFTIIGAQAMANYSQASIFGVLNASDTIVSDGWFKEWHGCAGQVFQGNCAAFKVMDSTGSELSRVRFSSPSYLGSIYESTWANVRSKNSKVFDCLFEGINAEVISVGTGRDTQIKRNEFRLGAGSQGDTFAGSYGVITIDGSDEVPSVGPSTMTVISDNFFTFVSTGGAAGNIIRLRSYGAGIANGIKILNNQVSSERRTNWTFFRANGGTHFNTILKGNDVDNLETFYNATSGSGVGDQYQSLGNMFNGKEQ